MLKVVEQIQPSDETGASEESPAHPSRIKSSLDFGQICAHLSNERTFLAWVWTGLVLMGFGVAIAKMRIAVSSLSQATGSSLQSGSNQISPIIMGMSFLALGLVTILMSAYRYLTAQNQIREQQYRPANFYLLLFLMALTVLGGTLMMHVLLLRQTME
ncbi:MAG TPA: DUF202 domain-containing protein [Chthonomonadaceae bacterium]|nr:DUF202 domain-containing protein [Chthonomonadaceae bacterium]